MATVTKTFSFATNTESFVATAGANSTLTFDSGIGNPAGSLKARIAGRNKNNLNYWEWTGTWESLGVPTGSTVTAIRVSAGYTRCTEYATGQPSTIGPYELYDNTPTLQATLWSGRNIGATDAAWVAVGGQLDQSVPSAIQPSNSTIRLRLSDSLATGASNTAAVTTYDDEVSFVITYTTPTPSSTSLGVRVIGASSGGGASVPATPVLDNFNRADGALGANWTQAIASYSMPPIASNAVALTQFPSAAWNSSFAADQEAYAKVTQTSGTSTPISLLLRANNLNQSGVTSAYRVVVYLNTGNTYAAEAFLVQSGSNTSLGFQNAVVPVGQSYFLARIVGSTISLYYSSDGVTYTLGKQWTDSTLSSSGYIGFYSSNNSGTGVVIDDFGGGAVATSTTSSTTQAVRVTGQSTSNTTQAVRVTGQAASNTSRTVKATGQAFTSAAQTIRVTGQLGSSTTQPIRTTGQATASRSQSVRITGATASVWPINNVRVTGGTASSQSVSVRVFGTTATNVTQSVRVTGTLPSSTQTSVRVTGGTATSTSSAGRVTGGTVAQQSTTVRTFGAIASAWPINNVRVTGGTSSFQTNDVRVTGVLSLQSSTSVGARVSSGQVAQTETDVRTFGEGRASQKQTVSITGQALSNIAVQARATGQATTSTATGVRVYADQGPPVDKHFKNFGFNSDSDGWIFTSGGTGQTSGWTNADGVLGVGAITQRSTASAETSNNYWEWSGTWEDLGVPAGAVITDIAAPKYSYKVSEFTAASSTSNAGTLELRDALGNLRFNIISGTSTFSGTTGWLTRTGVRNAGLNYSSNDSIKLRLNSSLVTNTGGAITLRHDDVQFEIWYSIPTTVTTSQDVRVSGHILASVSNAVRVSGQLGSNQSQTVRVSGQAPVATSQDARVVGQATSSASRDARITAQTTSSESVDARLTAQATTANRQDVRVTGYLTSAASLGARVTGYIGVGTQSDARVTGQDTATTSLGARLYGTAGSNTTLAIRVTGQADTQVRRDVRVFGYYVNNLALQARVSGQVITAASVDARITGTNTSAITLDARLVAQQQASTSTDVRVAAQDEHSVDRDVRVRGEAPTSTEIGSRLVGKGVTSASYEARISAQGQAAVIREARITAETGAQIALGARVTAQEGTTQRRDVRVLGQAPVSLEQLVRVAGETTSATSQDARLAGTATASDSRATRLVGQAFSDTSLDVRTEGRVEIATVRAARIFAFMPNETEVEASVIGALEASTGHGVSVTGWSGSNVFDGRNYVTVLEAQETELIGDGRNYAVPVEQRNEVIEE